MADASAVQTEADELLDLLGSVPSISYADAAKKLKVSEGTIESIATFLEEEGVVSIQYKLTTPYVSLVGSGAKSDVPHMSAERARALEASKISEPEISNASPVLQINSGSLEKNVEAFSEQWINLTDSQRINYASDLLGQMGKLAQIAFSSPELVAHAAPVQNELASTMRLFGEIQKQSSLGERSISLELFGELSNRIKSLSQRVLGLQLAAQYSSMLPENSAKVIQKIRELSSQKKFVQAELLYGLLKAKAVELPRTFYKKELQFDSDLSSLNQDLFSSYEKDKMERFALVSQELNSVIGKAHESLKSSDLGAADDFLRKSKQLLSELADVNPSQKADFESRVLRLAGDLLSKKKELHSKSFAEKSKIIEKLLGEVGRGIALGDVSLASGSYRELKTVFEALPDSYADQKIALQARILEAYQKLTVWYAKFSEAKFSSMEQSILTDVAELSVQLRLGQMERSQVLYQQIKKNFYGLPQGDVQRKIDLQQKILSVFEVFKQMYPQSVHKNFAQVHSQINLELEAASRALANSDVSMGWSQYYRVLELFKRLPLVDVEKRTEIRMRILGLYRALLQAADKQHIDSLGPEQQDTYQRLLSAIMKFHDSVHERKFDDLSTSFSLAQSLFSELPQKIASANNRVKQEIVLLGKQLELYNLVLRAKSEQDSGNTDSALAIVKTLAKDANSIRPLCPADEALFVFIDESLASILLSSPPKKTLVLPSYAPSIPSRRAQVLAAKDAAKDVQMNVAMRSAAVVAKASPSAAFNQGQPVQSVNGAAVSALMQGVSNSGFANPAKNSNLSDSGASVIERIERLRKIAYPSVRIPV